MQWIGIGFLIAIGFGLAIIALPVVTGLLVMAWELRAIVGTVAGVLAAIVVVIILWSAYPDQTAGIVGLGVIAFLVYCVYLQYKENKAKKLSPKG